MVMRTRINVTLHAHCISCSICLSRVEVCRQFPRSLTPRVLCIFPFHNCRISPLMSRITFSVWPHFPVLSAIFVRWSSQHSILISSLNIFFACICFWSSFSIFSTYFESPILSKRDTLSSLRVLHNMFSIPLSYEKD
jgi:hypothetical protein